MTSADVKNMRCATLLRPSEPALRTRTQGTIIVQLHNSGRACERFLMCYVHIHSLSCVRQPIYIRLQPGKSISMCRYRVSRKRESVCGGWSPCVSKGVWGSPRTVRVRKKKHIERPYHKTATPKE